jgi:K+-sensing histidine kinase KdpD
MDDAPSHTKNKVVNRRKEPSLQTALLPEALEATADIRGTGSKSPPRRAKQEGTSIPQRGKEYGVALGTTLLAFLLRWSLDSYLNDRLAHAAFLVAIAVTTWYGGIGPSLLAVLLGGLIANWVFLHPRYTFSFTDLEDQAGIAVYLTVSFALVGFAQTWRWAWKKTEEMTQELRMEMDRHRQTEEEPAHMGSTGSTSASQRQRRL